MSRNDNGWDPVKFDQWFTTSPDEDEDLSQPPEPGMVWNPAREVWAHAYMSHDEWASLSSDEQVEYGEPMWDAMTQIWIDPRARHSSDDTADSIAVDLKDLDAMWPDIVADLRDELLKVFQVPAKLLAARDDNQSVSEGGQSKQN